VIDLTGGGPPVEKQGFEGTRDMTPKGEDPIKDLSKGSESVDNLDLKGADERAAKYGNAETSREASTNEAIENLSTETDKSANDDTAYLGQNSLLNPSRISDIESQILNEHPTELPPDLYSPESRQPITPDRYDGWADQPPSLSPEQEREVANSLPEWMRQDPAQDSKEDGAIMPQDGDWRDAFSTLPDRAREIRDNVKNWVSDKLEPVRNFAREEIGELKDRAPSLTLDLLDKDKVLRLDPMREAIRYGIKDAFETGQNSPPLLGGLMRDEIARRTSKYVANGIRDRAIELTYDPQSNTNDPVEQEGDKVFRAAHPLNLSRGLKPYLENVQRKFMDFWGYMHDSFFSNSDR
jgi:hypothetical protein